MLWTCGRCRSRLAELEEVVKSRPRAGGRLRNRGREPCISRAVRGRFFTAPPEERLLQRATASATPMIVWQSWNGGSPGSTIDYRAAVLNPGPDDVVWVFGHVFVGAANVAEKTNYMGNLVLYRATWHDPAEYLDRSLFVFAVG